jgi:hypothetical protein
VPAASETVKNQVINALLTGGGITLRASDRDTTLDEQSRVELSVTGTDEPRLWRMMPTPMVWPVYGHPQS